MHVITYFNGSKIFNDTIRIAAYENEVCQAYDKFFFLKQDGSKRKILSKMASSTMSNDITILLEYIVETQKISLLRYEKSVMLTLADCNVTIENVSEELIDILTST